MRKTWTDAAGFEDGGRSHRLRTGSGLQRLEKARKASPLPQSLQKETQPSRHLNFIPVKPMQDFGPPEIAVIAATGNKYTHQTSLHLGLCSSAAISEVHTAWPCCGPSLDY